MAVGDRALLRIDGDGGRLGGEDPRFRPVPGAGSMGVYFVWS
jgi:hypothetical protein